MTTTVEFVFVFKVERGYRFYGVIYEYFNRHFIYNLDRCSFIWKQNPEILYMVIFLYCKIYF
jgi:hypothetical protein